MSKYLIGLALALSTISAAEARNISGKQAFGAPVRAQATVTVTTPGAPQRAGAATNSNALAQPQHIDVFLMSVNLSAEQKKKLTTFHAPANTATGMTATSNLPARVELGMNNVPVLNQGMHGSCVTFANVAALDALLGRGDYVSPLCALELGSYLEAHGYMPSGWNGTFGPWFLSRIREFGIVSIANQTTKTCGGLSQYPTMDMDNEGRGMSVEEYYQISETINDNLYWYSLVTSEERFNWDASQTELPEQLLFNVKKALASKNAKLAVRVTFGSLLPVGYCSAGACAKYHKTNDTWALTKSILKDNDPDFGGHEMVFTGYDDNAVAIDNEGGKHKGLLFIRNSWSDRVGDNGDFYMTYDFFKQYVMEAQVIVNPLQQQ